MVKYRVKEYDNGFRKSYVTQRKSIFGFWYNPDNKDACTTGWYDTLELASEAIERKLVKRKFRVVKEWN